MKSPLLYCVVFCSVTGQSLGLFVRPTLVADERTTHTASIESSVTDGKGTWTIQLDGQVVAVLQSDLNGTPGLYPLFSPSGRELTRGYPMKQAGPFEKTDHPHHRSLWFTHGIVNGVDFWLDRGAEHLGKIVQSNAATHTTDRVATITTQNEWIGPKGEVVLRDKRVMAFQKMKGMNVIDFGIELLADQPGDDDQDVVFGDTKEGTFGVRVAGTMKVEAGFGGTIENAQGEKDDATWSKASDWVDYSGPVAPAGTVSDSSMDPKAWPVSGITIMAHPKNDVTPTRWHVRTYGLFAANPFGRHHFGEPEYEGVRIPGGESIQLNYRVLLHDDELDRQATQAMFESYKSE